MAHTPPVGSTEPSLGLIGGSLFLPTTGRSSPENLALQLPARIPEPNPEPSDRQSLSARSSVVAGSGLLSPTAQAFAPGKSPLFHRDPVWAPDGPGWGGIAPQPQVSVTAARRESRDRSASRSAPTTPRVVDLLARMHSTAPVTPSDSLLSPPSPAGALPGPAGASMHWYQSDSRMVFGASPQQRFPLAPDLVYSAPVRLPSEMDEDDGFPMPKHAEHPSRTLFVRNLANDTDPLALQADFEQFGPIRSMYANCKYRGFVMISFFDIRHAKEAMLVLNGKRVQGKKMDIHYALPKDNPGEKEVNQGTLVVFNLDVSMSDDDIRAVFSEHGEVKDIRSTPNKNTHKFVEFYDVRDAERALLALNRTKVRGKMIKIEVSRPSNRGKQTPPSRFPETAALAADASTVALFGGAGGSGGGGVTGFSVSPTASAVSDTAALYGGYVSPPIVPQQQQPLTPQQLVLLQQQQQQQHLMMMRLHQQHELQMRRLQQEQQLLQQQYQLHQQLVASGASESLLPPAMLTATDAPLFALNQATADTDN